MVKIINPFAAPNPISQALERAAASLGGDTLTPALKREQLMKAQRENVEAQNTAAMLAQFGQPGFDRAQLAATDYLAGGKGSNLADIEMYLAANQGGFDDPATSAAMLGAGKAASSTPIGFTRSEARQERQNKYNTDTASGDRRYGIDVGAQTDRYKFDNALEQVVTPEGHPMFVRRSEAAGQAPVLSETEQKGTLLGQNFGDLESLDPLQRSVLGAEPKNPPSPKNYVVGDQSFITYDGVNDARTGQPLPEGGFIAGVQGSAKDAGVPTATQNKSLQDMTALKNFFDLIKRTRTVAESDPTIFGATGAARSAAQGTSEGLSAAAALFGLKPEEIRTRASATANQILAGANPGELDTGILMRDFDPNLPDIQLLGNMLVYSGAEAMAGQAGRAMSDKDVEMWRGIIGDPQGWLTSQKSYLQRLGTMEQVGLQRFNRQREMMNLPPVTLDQIVGGVPATPAAPRPSGKTSRGTSWEVVE